MSVFLAIGGIVFIAVGMHLSVATFILGADLEFINPDRHGSSVVGSGCKFLGGQDIP